MESHRMELDSSGHELRGSTIAGEISSVNHRTPCPSAQPIEGRVKLSDDQKRANKREADMRCNKKKKQKENEMKNELTRLENCYGELKRGNDSLKRLRDELEVKADEEYRKILSQLENEYAGQNTEINIVGESSNGHGGLNDQQEMNQAPITSSIFSRKNASMNPQTLPQSAQPAGSFGLTDIRKVKKRIADKNHRDNKKRKIQEIRDWIEEFKKINVELDKDNTVLSTEATRLQKTLSQFGNISAQMTYKTARKNATLEKLLNDYMLQNSSHGSTPFNTKLQNYGQRSTPFNTELQNYGQRSTPFNTELQNSYQESTPFNTELNLLVNWYFALEERHKQEIALVERHAHDQVAVISQELENLRQELADLKFNPDDLLRSDNEDTQE